MPKLFWIALVALWFAWPADSLRSADEVAAPSDAEAVLFFEAKIRPALTDYCLECHAADTEASGGLLLDSRAGWMAGGDSGPSIEVGQAEASRLYRAITYADPSLQMPPDGKLPEDVIQAFQRWIDSGAVDPRQADVGPPQPRQTGLPVDRAAEHWAYRPLSRPSLEPRSLAGDAGSSRPGAAGTSAIDHFINRELLARGLVDTETGLAPPASRDVLARRLYFDLTGLPPTPSELREFVNDASVTAYERLVDRLLASPRFGETFARRWMDVVRYADSITLRGFVLPEAWRYRDYLIKAFAEDRSFAQMISEQVAGDLLEADDPERRAEQLVATGFWAMGNTNLEQQDKLQLEMDYIDEQLEVFGRAFLAQTIGCARCHDHKFDPIPTKDYYALAGILRSTVGLEHSNVSKWLERPLPLDADSQRQFDRLQQERVKLAAEVASLKKRVNGLAAADQRLIPVAELEGIVVDSAQAKLVGEWIESTHVGRIVGQSYLHDANQGKGQKTVTLEPPNLPPGEYHLRLAYQAADNRTSRLAVRVFSADGEATVTINQRVPAEEDGLWTALGTYRFEQDGQGFVLISNADTDGHVIVDAVQFLPVNDPLAGRVTAAPSPASQASQASQAAENQRHLAGQLSQLEKELAALDRRLANRPHYLAIVEEKPPQEIAVHIRGDVHNLGEVVPRGFLTAIEPQRPELQLDSGGRVQLADWLCAAENPLTARVYANRMWSWLMGQGLVASVNNFGTTGTLPSHPELLDWLACQLRDQAWSTKQLVREIVLSQAYRRAIIEPTELVQTIDPDNRLYWRGASRRLPVESLRDTMLLVSGELELTIGGSLLREGTTADYNYQHRSTRRSIYQPVLRNSLPELYEAFDFADTSVSVGRRSRSTVATQALVMMNHPWVTERARQTAQRWLRHAPSLSTEQLIEMLYIECLGRLPTAEEFQACGEFLRAGGGDTRAGYQHPERLQQLVQSLFASIDFRYLE